MRLFDFFKSTSNTNNEHKVMDERKFKCPYCHKTLDKIPSKKTKCPHCGEYMFVRTRPKDNVRVVVTKVEADKIEEDWAIVSGTHDSFIAEKEKFKNEQKVLRKRFSKEPSENDVKWSLFNKDLLKYAQSTNWCMYSSTRFQMAEILRKEQRLERALQIYLEVCYIDLNGPSNMDRIDDSELLEELPLFDPEKLAFLAPGVIDRIKLIMKKMSFDKEKINTMFIEHNSKIEKHLRLPIPAKRAWQSLEKEI